MRGSRSSEPPECRRHACTPLWHARRPGRRHIGGGILIEQEALLLEGVGGASDLSRIALAIGIAFLQREPGVARRSALVLAKATFWPAASQPSRPSARNAQPV
jgi:hypothetical protein